MFHVYQIIEKENGKPVYIGCSRNPRKRSYTHRMNGLLTDAREFQIVFSAPSKRKALDFERGLIQANKAQGLTNKFPRVVFRVGDRIFSRSGLAIYLKCSKARISTYLRQGYPAIAEIWSLTRGNVTVERIEQ